MSSPYHGANDDDDQERGGTPPEYPAYRPTPHPEDSSSFTYPSYGMGYDQGYGQSAAADGPGYGYGAPGGPAMEQGSGRIDVMRAISWGFRQAYRNWKVWILGVLALIVLSGVLGGIGGLFSTPGSNGAGAVAGVVLNVLVSLVMMALGVFALRAALHQVDDPGMGWGHVTRDVNFWPTLLLQFLLGLLSTGLVAIVVGGSLLGFGESFADPTALETASEAELVAAVGSLFAAVGLVMLISLLINPFIMFMPYYLVERRADFLGSIREGFRAGARNYLRLLLTFAVVGILTILAVILTFGIAAIFLVGPWYLAQAHMYRQAAGGAIPAP